LERRFIANISAECVQSMVSKSVIERQR